MMRVWNSFLVCIPRTSTKTGALLLVSAWRRNNFQERSRDTLSKYLLLFENFIWTTVRSWPARVLICLKLFWPALGACSCHRIIDACSCLAACLYRKDFLFILKISYYSFLFFLFLIKPCKLTRLVCFSDRRRPRIVHSRGHRVFEFRARECFGGDALPLEALYNKRTFISVTVLYKITK